MRRKRRCARKRGQARTGAQSLRPDCACPPRATRRGAETGDPRTGVELGTARRAVCGLHRRQRTARRGGASATLGREHEALLQSESWDVQQRHPDTSRSEAGCAGVERSTRDGCARATQAVERTHLGAAHRSSSHASSPLNTHRRDPRAPSVTDPFPSPFIPTPPHPLTSPHLPPSPPPSNPLKNPHAPRPTNPHPPLAVLRNPRRRLAVEPDKLLLDPDLVALPLLLLP